MRNFWVLYCKEMKTFFISPVAYMVMFLYSFVNGAIFYLWLGIMSRQHVTEYTIFQALVEAPFFWFVLLIQAPIITMRTFSEEYKLGTIEMLLTAPVREWEIVLAKYFATLTFFILLWIPLPLNLGYVQWFSNTPNVFSWGMVLLPLIMLLLLGGFYVAIGLLTSALTKNQIISAIFSFAIIFLFFGLSFLGYTQEGVKFHDFLEYVSSIEHMGTAATGILDTRPVVFYLTGTAFFLFLTQRILEGRRLKA